MPDLVTVAAIITAVAGVATIFSACVGYLVLRRTPKLPEPSFVPTSTTILGANMNGDLHDLPSVYRRK